MFAPCLHHAKVPRPDEEDDRVGTLVLDEPAAHQSDRTILEMQLRATSKRQHKDMAVVSMEHPFNGADIQRWIDNINDLHRTKVPQHRLTHLFYVSTVDLIIMPSSCHLCGCLHTIRPAIRPAMRAIHGTIFHFFGQ